jgi:hypothetical protein
MGLVPNAPQQANATRFNNDDTEHYVAPLTG